MTPATTTTQYRRAMAWGLMLALSCLWLASPGAQVAQADDGADGVQEPSDPGFDAILFAAYPELVGAEFLDQLKSARLIQAIDTALNSDGDELQLLLGGELYVPVWPGISVGGGVDRELTLSRGTSAGQTIYQLSTTVDGIAAAQASAGIAGAALGATRSRSVTFELASPAQLAQCIQRLVLLDAMGPRAREVADELAGTLGRLDRELARLRALRAQLTGWLARFLPAGIGAKLAQLEARRRGLAQAVARARSLADQVRAAEAAVEGSAMILELEAGRELSAALGTKLISAGGNGAGIVGIEWEGALSPSVSVRATIRNRRPEEATIELRVAREDVVRAGVGPSVAVSLAAEVVITGTGAFTDEGFVIDRTNQLASVSLDRSFAATYWQVVGPQVGVARETSATVALSDLLALGTQGIELLLDSDPVMAAILLEAFPITFEGQARIDRAAHAGLGMDLGEKFLSMGVYADLWWTDRGAVASYEGWPSLPQVAALFTVGTTEQPLETLETLKSVATELAP